MREKSVVIVDEQHVFPADELQTEVTALGGTAAGGASDEGVLRAEEFCGGGVGGGIVMVGDEDDFVVGEGVSEDGMEAALEEVCAVVRCDDDREEGESHGGGILIWDDLLSEMRGGASRWRGRQMSIGLQGFGSLKISSHSGGDIWFERVGVGMGIDRVGLGASIGG